MLDLKIGEVPDVLDYEQIVIDGTARGATAAKVSVAGRGPAKTLIVTPSVATRYRLDGTNPTASTGHLIAADETITIAGGGNISRARFIAESSSGTAELSFGY